METKTPATMRGGKHFFHRYYFTDDYAKVMRCARCGISINSVTCEADAVAAVVSGGADPYQCIKTAITW